jgi:hypothetical protein
VVVTVSRKRWHIVGLCIVLLVGIGLAAIAVEAARTVRSDRAIAAYCRGLSRDARPSEIRQRARLAGFRTREAPGSAHNPSILEIGTGHWLPSICSVRYRGDTVVSITLDPWYE